MENKIKRLFPDCPCCGKRLEKKNELLPNFVQCPKCKNEHYFSSNYSQSDLEKLSIADKKRNAHQYDAAYIHYDIIANENPKLIEAYWGLFLSNFGIVYQKEETGNRFIPIVHQFYDEQPIKNKHYLQILELTTDRHMKKHFTNEVLFVTKAWRDNESKIKRIDKTKDDKSTVIEKHHFEQGEFRRITPKVIGSDLIVNYETNPIIENQIKSAEQLYLKKNKFTKALKIYNEVLEQDPLAQKAWWDKILCTLHIQEFRELSAQVSLNNIFELFDKLMGCLEKKQAPFYLQLIEDHLIKELNVANKFDQELYNFLMTWKSVKEQNRLADDLYQKLHLKLNLENLENVDWIYCVMETATRYIPKQDSRFIKKYVETSLKVNRLGFHSEAIKLSNIVLSASPDHREIILLQLCAKYRAIDISKLNEVLNDIEFTELLQRLIVHKYKITEVFYEIQIAVNRLISADNYKMAVKLIDIYLKYSPKTEKETVNKVLLIFTENFIYKRKYSRALLYAGKLIENIPKNNAAYWAKFKISLKAHSNFEVLMKAKKDLMEYPDFEKALNATSDNKDYIMYYEIHDLLRKPDFKDKIRKKGYKRNFDFFDDMCDRESVKTFVSMIYPKMRDSVSDILMTQNKVMFNLFNRSAAVLLLIAFAFLMSNVPSFFDPANTINPIVVSYNILLFFRDRAAFIIVPFVIIAYVVLWIIGTESTGKGVLKGLLWGLLAAAISLGFMWGVPWVTTRFLTGLLFRIPARVVSSVLFGLSAIASFFILKKFHQQIKAIDITKTTNKNSVLNIVILVLIWVTVFAITLFVVPLI